MSWKDPFSKAANAVRESAGSVAAFFTSGRVWRYLLILLAIGIVAVMAWRGAARVHEGEVGIFVNNLAGTIRVEDRAGYHFFVPWVYTLYRMDRRVQSLVMTDQGDTGFESGDAVMIKTKDGSNISLDILVQYRLIPEQAAAVLRNAGPETAFGSLWARSAVRAMVAREFGQLITESIYDSTLRNERARAVVTALNEQLAGHGIEVIAVVPQQFRFYREYEEIIKQKKLADQEVEEQKARARLATEEQVKQVTTAKFEAEHKLAEAQGEADRTRARADGYAKKTRLDAEAELTTQKRQAEGTLVRGLAEAEGLRQAAAALAGPGGANMVALQFARQLGQIKFNGVPVVQEGVMGMYHVQHAPDSASPASVAPATAAPATTAPMTGAPAPENRSAR